MSSTIFKAKKPSMCNRCYTYVNWNNQLRQKFGTTRPLNTEGTAIHECPKDGAGNVIVNFENKAIYDQAVGQTTVGSPGNPATTSSSSTTGASSPQITSNDVLTILGTVLQKLNDLTTEQASFSDAVTRMEDIIKRQEDMITRYIQYDPVGTTLANLVSTLMKHLPESELKPKTADKLPRATTTYADNDQDLEV